MAKSVDHATMREMNLGLILKTLHRQAPISRAGLAAYTGLNKASVSGMVRELLEHDIIREMASTSETAEVGRPPIHLELNPETGYILSAEIGVGFVLVVAADFSLEVVLRDYRDINGLDSPQAILDQLIIMLARALDQLARRDRRVFGIAVGVAGLVDMSSGTVLFAPNMVWNDIPIQRILTERFALPIYVANEANMGAIGESYQQEESADFLLYVSSGIGLGGGIVLNGQLQTGISGFAGEIGHMTIDPDGRQCRCGNWGCWETVASQQALFQNIRARIAAGEASQLRSQNLKRLTVSQIIAAADAGDTLALDALQEVGHWLGIGIASLVNIISPQRVVFGGPLAEAHRYLLPIIEQTVQQRSFPRLRDSVEIITSAYFADAAVMGGVAMLHKEILNYPTEWLLLDD